MKHAQGTPRFLVVFEVLALVFVLILCISRPTIKISDQNSESDAMNENTIINQQNTQQIDADTQEETWKSEFSKDVVEQVEAMRLEQKVAQMFFLTPEALTGADKVTLTGSTSKNALKEYPIGGLVYSALNF